MTNTDKPFIYLAAPLFTPLEREFNGKIESAISAFCDVFLPQRDGALLTDLVKSGMPVECARKKIFETDKLALEHADFAVAVLDGRTIDEGVAFEIGYLSALGKKCIALKTDDRCMLPTGDNPMIISACFRIAFSFEEFVSTIRSHCNDWHHNKSKVPHSQTFSVTTPFEKSI